MKKIIIFLIILIATILLSSCSSHRTPLNAGCNCPTTNFGLGWNNNIGFGWNNNPFWGWNDPFWGWNNNMIWGGFPFGIRQRYYIQPNRFQPQQPTRYERRSGRVSVPQRGMDNMYPQRTPNMLNRSDYNSQPANRNTTPSRIQSNPTRTQSPTRSAYPQRRIQSPPSRNTSPVYRTPSNRTTSPPSRVGRGGN